MYFLVNLGWMSFLVIQTVPGAHGQPPRFLDSVTRLLYIRLFSIARRQITTYCSWWPMGIRIIHTHIYVNKCTRRIMFVYSHTYLHKKIYTEDLGRGVRASFHKKPVQYPSFLLRRKNLLSPPPLRSQR